MVSKPLLFAGFCKVGIIIWGMIQGRIIKKLGSDLVFQRSRYHHSVFSKITSMGMASGAQGAHQNRQKLGFHDCCPCPCLFMSPGSPCKLKDFSLTRFGKILLSDPRGRFHPSQPPPPPAPPMLVPSAPSLPYGQPRLVKMSVWGPRWDFRAATPRISFDLNPPVPQAYFVGPSVA